MKHLINVRSTHLDQEASPIDPMLHSSSNTLHPLADVSLLKGFLVPGVPNEPIHSTCHIQLPYIVHVLDRSFAAMVNVPSSLKLTIIDYS
jgi:hypothetical protein